MSTKYSLNKEDLIKIARGAAIATGGALVTYGLTVINDINFGEYTPIVVALSSIVLNAVMKFIEGVRQE